MTKQDYIKELLNQEQNEIVEVLNYSNIICRVKAEDIEKLILFLNLDNCNHMYNMKYVEENKLFYIENCDLQYLSAYEGFSNNDEWLDDYLLYDISFTNTGFILTEAGQTCKKAFRGLIK